MGTTLSKTSSINTIQKQSKINMDISTISILVLWYAQGFLIIITSLKRIDNAMPQERRYYTKKKSTHNRSSCTTFDVFAVLQYS
ncbi:uncharacterized protein LY89DRAFT_313225 [Mollisia scopiformis]|uniref:Uncharacterized protein n=1 Tax=Mollisia scopiformis TaxID=149040 RepID=A0A194XT57_MOLSC|nr:uncharacterized protein LY89DRAFT_313225 [Mollisia scopiformis]KUJ22882.1 hypothetical protein LY89DRAFT_313225 [Mollisia scopiformis]